ncbi:MAG: TonB-dependent receptor [Candidatus Marinimicrobia bacterium]|nr:TonB-dependent receptor [Candidatus Neomarinimicrobiota bacterium]
MRFNSRSSIIIILSVVMVCLNTSLFAQETGKIQGVVEDAETGQPLPGVNVYIEGTELGAATDSEGRYFIINIPVGTYEITASMIGYAQLTKTDVLVQIDRTSNVSFSLTTSAIEGEQVTVVAERDILHKETSNTQQVLTSEQVIQAPATRSVEDFVSKQVGVSGNLGIRGSSSDQTGTIVNGFTFVNQRLGTPDATLPLSAIEQISVVTGGFNAEHGNFRSGLVNITTKTGNVENYTGRIDYSQNIPHMKRFGPSLFDVSNYYIRPELDPNVAFVGTNEAWADDPYLQGQYSSFAGWNSLAEQYNDGKDPAEQVEPIDLYLWDAWMHQVNPPWEALLDAVGYTPTDEISDMMAEHARTPEGSNSDWNVDFGFGGPLPFVSGFLGDATFYLSNNTSEYYYAQPVTRRSQTESTTMLTLQSNLSSSLKLTLNGLYRDKRGVNRGTRDARFENIINLPPDGGERWLFAPNYYSEKDQYTSLAGIELRKVVNPNTHWNLRLNTEQRIDRSVPPYLEAGLSLSEFEETGYYEGHPDPRSAENDAVLYFGPIPVDNSPYGFSAGKEVIDGFQYNSYLQPFGVSHHRFAEDLEKTIDSTDSRQYRMQFDISSQVNFHHLIKAGMHFQYSNIDHTMRSVRFAHLRNNFTQFWKRNPINAGIYLQDQISFEGMVANIGLRADYYDPGGEWPTGVKYSEEAFGTSDQLENKFDTWDALGILEPVETHLVLSPRLGISFPVTERSKFYFNYGHFRSLAPWFNMFVVNQRPLVRLYDLGNPNLAPPRTISYETGVEYNLLNEILIHVSGYFKDVTGQHGQTSYHNIAGTVNYDSWLNNEYEDILGLEISIQRNFGQWITGWANYDYQIQKSGRVGRSDFYEDPSRQAVFGLYEGDERRPLPRPRFRANVTFHVPNQFGPQLGNIHPLGGWLVSLLPTWVSGDYDTWNPLGELHLQDNIRWPDYYVWDMKFSKFIDIGGIGLEAYANISNLFNNKVAHFGRAFDSGSDRRDYLASLHLPMYDSPEFDDLRANSPEGYYTPGDDKPGDVRSSDKPYINDPNIRMWLWDQPRDIWLGLTLTF